ncbi:MAG: hypothetical protein ABSE48_22790 [Verrucomicrobiota bacterium]
MKIILSVALILNGALCGCTTGNTHHPSRIQTERNQTAGDLTAGLQMSLSLLNTNKEDRVLQISIRNAGAEDVCLNLGTMLANGKFLIPGKISLRLSDTNGNLIKLHFFDRRFAGVAGRVDDYVIPLRSDSTYTLELPLDEFASAFTGVNVRLKTGRYKLSAQFEGEGAQMMNVDLGGMRLVNFWKGTLQSNELVIDE